MLSVPVTMGGLVQFVFAKCHNYNLELGHPHYILWPRGPLMTQNCPDGKRTDIWVCLFSRDMLGNEYFFTQWWQSALLLSRNGQIDENMPDKKKIDLDLLLWAHLWPGSEKKKPASFFMSLVITLLNEVQMPVLTLIFWRSCHTLASFFLNLALSVFGTLNQKMFHFFF